MLYLLLSFFPETVSFFISPTKKRKVSDGWHKNRVQLGWNALPCLWSIALAPWICDKTGFCEVCVVGYLGALLALTAQDQSNS